MQSLRYRCQQSSASLLDGQRYKYIDNGSNVLAVAHVDSVTCGLNRFKQRGSKVYSTSLDDRLGVHVILDILPTIGIRPDVLLTDDEEIGRSTAQLFQTDKRYNWMFQFDRRGQDAVHYDYIEMAPHIRSFFTLGQGSFSDICWLEHLGCAGLNVGTGYYNEHTRASYANLEHTMAQVARFRLFWEALKDTFIPHTPYVPPKTKTKARQFYAGYDYDDYDTKYSYDDAELEVTEYDRIARIMGYRSVDDMIEWESLPGRAAALDLIDEFIYGADGFRAQYTDNDDDDIWSEYVTFDDRLF